MILQALHQLYGRLAEDPANKLPKPGYSKQTITFKIVLRPDGTLSSITSLPDPIEMDVPGKTKSSGQGFNPCLLWDNLTYLCGYPQPNPDASKAATNRERAPKCFRASLKRHLSLRKQINDKDFTAVCRFLARHRKNIGALAREIAKLDVPSRKGNGVFQMVGVPSYVHSTMGFVSWWEKSRTQNVSEADGCCLVTGEPAKIARLHEPGIRSKGIWRPKGANPPPGGSYKLVSFNESAYESYGKVGKEHGQGLNSPVAEEVAEAYCTALNHILSSDRRRFHLGDATAVFWTDRPADAEDLLPFLIGSGKSPEHESLKQRLAAVLEKLSEGKLAADDLGDATTPFYVLGLSPNTTRLSVRFWHTSTLGDLAANLQKHHHDLAIVRQWDETNSKNPEPTALGVYTLLLQTVPPKDGRPDSTKISPLLGGAILRSVLMAGPYPDALLIGALNRIQAEREVSYPRAAIIKAFLNRNHQRNHTPMLDESNNHHAYRLGRLFAVLERIQEEGYRHQTGSLDIPRTIRDTYFGSASRTPASVFSRLDQLGNIYRRHLPPGRKTFFDKLIQDIKWGQLAPKPVLHARDQGEFVLGYYHQRKALFPTKVINEKTPV